GEDGLLAAVVDNTAKISAADRLAAAARDRGTDRDATGADVHDAGVQRGGICNAAALNVECAAVDCRVDGRTVVLDEVGAAAEDVDTVDRLSGKRLTGQSPTGEGLAAPGG